MGKEREVGERWGRGESSTTAADVRAHCFLRSKTSSANIMSTRRGTLSSSCKGRGKMRLSGKEGEGRRGVGRRGEGRGGKM